jgi:glycine cleavage system H protein
MSERPSDRQYTRTHEWVRIEGDEATMGITDWAVEHLGDLVFVDLPQPGRVVTAGESMCEVESVKAVGEVYAPASGEVVEVNSALADDPAGLAQDPYGEGWLVRLKLAPDGDRGDLMDLAAYENHLATEPTS